MKIVMLEKFAALTTAAFGLVAALAWNEAIKALFVGPCGAEKAGALCSLSLGGPWIYAMIVTIIAVLVIYFIGKAEQKAKEAEFDLDLKKHADRFGEHYDRHIGRHFDRHLSKIKKFGRKKEEENE